MAKKQFLTALAKQLGLYQLTLLLSRLAGISRDVLILLVVGAGTLTDQIFFIFSFPDIFMSFLVGGGAVLFLSDRYNEKDGVEKLKSIAASGALFYLFIAALFIVVEVLFHSPVGEILYVDIAKNAELNTAYLVSIVALLFSLPMVASNSVFLFKDKLYLQPLMNIVFTIVVIVLILATYYGGKLSTNMAGFIIIVASASRLLVSGMIALNICREELGKLTFVRDLSFYKGLILSGLSIGVLVLLPFIFRAKLPEFGDGLYASSAIYFKLNDLVLAFFVIPITALLLKKERHHESAFKGRLLLAAFVFSSLAALVISVGINMVSRLGLEIPILSATPELAVLIAICLVFAAVAYVSSMMLVKSQKHKISAIAAGISLGYMLLAQWRDQMELQRYFYDLYVSYLIYIGVIIVSSRFSREKDAGNDYKST